MKLDTATLRPVIIAMIVYLAMAKLFPSLKSTGVKPIDDVTAYFIMNKGDIMSGLIVVALVTFVALRVEEIL